MAYILDPEALSQKLNQAGLKELTDKMRDLQLKQPIALEVRDNKELMQVRYLIYSFLKLTGLTRTYRIELRSSNSITIRPSIPRVQQHTMAESTKQAKVDGSPGDYQPPDFDALFKNPDDSL